ncbi:MAG: hypothetical protein KF830_11725 [Planctomycetes bacterium]|nr:hypothetical protein [Planctomycetota bacterium]
MRCRLLASLASLCAVATGRAQDFVPTAAVVAPPAAVALGHDRRLELVDGSLWLSGADGRRPVGCTAADGSGAVHALARHAHGTVFVAATRGWFALDAEHAVLDRMELRDGVPPGSPRGVGVDRAGRLWLCTDEAFGVVDPRFGFGRTFGAADGLPAAPFRGLELDAEGRVLLVARDGTFAYTPDQGPPPRRSDGQVPRVAVTASAAGEVELAVGVEGRGGVTLRQRRWHHHLLQAMPGQRLVGLRPGRHVVEVHAVDRDLRRAVVGIYDVRVPPPAAFDARVLPLLAGGGGLLLFLLAWWRPRPGLPARRRFALAMGNSALAMVCGLQLLAAWLGYGRSWPFVGFTMYTETWRQDDVLHKPRLVGLLADGTRVEGAAHEAGILQDGYWQMLAEVAHGDAAAHRALLQRWNAGRPAGLPRLAGFRLVDGRIRLSARGPVDVAPTVLVHHGAP